MSIAVCWVDDEQSIPEADQVPWATAAQDFVRLYLAAIAAQGHRVTDARLFEEIAKTPDGGVTLYALGVRAVRTECTVNGHRVVIEYRSVTYPQRPYVVAVDGRVQTLPDMDVLTRDEKAEAIAEAVHDAVK